MTDSFKEGFTKTASKMRGILKSFAQQASKAQAANTKSTASDIAKRFKGYSGQAKKQVENVSSKEKFQAALGNKK